MTMTIIFGILALVAGLSWKRRRFDHRLIRREIPLLFFDKLIIKGAGTDILLKQSTQPGMVIQAGGGHRKSVQYTYERDALIAYGKDFSQ